MRTPMRPRDLQDWADITSEFEIERTAARDGSRGETQADRLPLCRCATWVSHESYEAQVHAKFTGPRQSTRGNRQR